MNIKPKLLNQVLLTIALGLVLIILFLLFAQTRGQPVPKQTKVVPIPIQPDNPTP